MFRYEKSHPGAVFLLSFRVGIWNKPNRTLSRTGPHLFREFQHHSSSWAIRILKMQSSYCSWIHQLSTFACLSCKKVKICRNSLTLWKLGGQQLTLMKLSPPKKWNKDAWKVNKSYYIVQKNPACCMPVLIFFRHYSKYPYYDSSGSYNACHGNGDFRDIFIWLGFGSFHKLQPVRSVEEMYPMSYFNYRYLNCKQ